MQVSQRYLGLADGCNVQSGNNLQLASCKLLASCWQVVARQSHEQGAWPCTAAVAPILGEQSPALPGGRDEPKARGRRFPPTLKKKKKKKSMAMAHVAVKEWDPCLE